MKLVRSVLDPSGRSPFVDNALADLVVGFRVCVISKEYIASCSQTYKTAAVLDVGSQCPHISMHNGHETTG